MHKGRVELELTAGPNKVQVSVHNVKGIESLRQTFDIAFAGAAPKPDLYVVAIGVSDYADDAYDLNYAAKDARDLVAQLKSDKTRWGTVRATTLVDRAVTPSSLKNVKKLLATTKVDDTVVLFVAGHGLLDDKLDYYFATHDTVFTDPAKNSLPYAEVEGLVDGIPARNKLMLIDACHSGEVDKEAVVLADAGPTTGGKVKSRGFKRVKQKTSAVGLETSFALMQELFTDLRRGTGAMVISSASGAEFAYESSEWNNGVFTFAVIEGLRGKADADANKTVIVSELRDYVVSRVKTLTNGLQTPTMRHVNLEHDFELH